MSVRQTDTVIPGKGKGIVAMFLIHNKVSFYSIGQSGRYARVRASQEALKELEGLPPYEYRRRYGCQCVQDGTECKMSVEEMSAKEAMGPTI